MNVANRVPTELIVKRKGKSKMWIGYNEQSSIHNDVYLIMGKALRLCQNLEMNINNVALVAMLEDGIINNRINKIFDEEWDKVVSQIEKYVLKSKIEQIDKTGDFSKQTIDKLNNGRISRNKIVHDSLKMLSNSIHNSTIQKDELNMYLEEVKNVAIADNFVSGLDWIITEKEPPCKSEESYVSEIIEWVMNI